MHPSLPVERALQIWAEVLDAAAAELVVVVATEDDDPDVVVEAEEATVGNRDDGQHSINFRNDLEERRT